MGVPSSGQLKLRGNGDGTGINEEVFGNVTATNVSLGALATEAGFDTPPDSMREFYGYVSAVVPSVSTNSATSVTFSGFTANGNVTSDGDATITERGFYMGTDSGTATNNTKYTVSGTTGTFSRAFTGLSAGTTYYFFAFATNEIGTTIAGAVSVTVLLDPNLSISISRASAPRFGNISWTFSDSSPATPRVQINQLPSWIEDSRTCSFGGSENIGTGGFGENMSFKFDGSANFQNGGTPVPNTRCVTGGSFNAYYCSIGTLDVSIPADGSYASDTVSAPQTQWSG